MATRVSAIGFVVMESCEHYEQVLALYLSKDKPSGGVLTWAEGKRLRVVFPTRAAARQAVTRTEHYRKAFGRIDLPEAKFCRVEMIGAVTDA
jgi:hypothetical protein